MSMNEKTHSFIVVPAYPILIKNKMRNSPTPMELNKTQFLNYLCKGVIYENTPDGLVNVTKEDINRLFGEDEKK